MRLHRSHLTLVLTTILHLFTHAYGVILVPLYLLLVADLHLSGVKSAALVVSAYGVVYSLFSFNAGMLADRYDRKWLLGLGLLGNALAVGMMGFSTHYVSLLVLAVMGGLFGTLFHPTANSLLPAHYPKSPGMVIGLLGIGSGLGFYVGPKFAGWRAETAHWWPGRMSAWQRPLVELGAAGVIVAIAYLIFASEAGRKQAGMKKRQPLDRLMLRRTFCIALTLCWRDFAGVASITLLSIYLQKARHMDVRQTGAMIGAMMLLSILFNPLLVCLSPGSRRLPALAAAMLVGGAMLMTVPWISMRQMIPVLGLFQACHLGSYALSDAAMLERVPDAQRGRVAGLFLLFAGTISAMSPWVMGWWIDLLGDRASTSRGFVPIFITLGMLMATAISSLPFIARLGAVQGTPVEAMAETMPASVEVVG